MPDSETFIPIEDLDAWDAFWAENVEALTDEIGDEPTCRALASNHLLRVGGGAAHLFRVGFVS